MRRSGDGLREERDDLIERQEKTGSGGVGYRDGTAGRDLLGKQRRDAARRTDNVDEPDRCELRVREHGQLGDTLGGAHDAVRRDGFVCGDEDHLASAMVRGDLREEPGPDAIGCDRRKGIALHEGDMFERGGVKDQIRAMLVENGGQQRAVADATEDRDAEVSMTLPGKIG